MDLEASLLRVLMVVVAVILKRVRSYYFKILCGVRLVSRNGLSISFEWSTILVVGPIVVFVQRDAGERRKTEARQGPRRICTGSSVEMENDFWFFGGEGLVFVRGSLGPTGGGEDRDSQPNYETCYQLT